MYRKQIDICQCLVGLGLDLTLIFTRINNLWNSAGSLAAIYQRHKRYMYYIYENVCLDVMDGSTYVYVSP